MIKIEIKHEWTGKVLFELTKENNTVRETLLKATQQSAFLHGADLRNLNLKGLYLRGAYLRGVNFSGSSLQNVDFQGANLQNANFQDADLRSADFQDADIRCIHLQGALMQGADIEGRKIKKAVVFTGVYKYSVIAYITIHEEKRIKMGCYDRTLAKWEENFWNNEVEFPNDNSEKSNLRLLAFETAKKWFEIVK